VTPRADAVKDGLLATAGGGAKRPWRRWARCHADPGRDRAAHARLARGSVCGRSPSDQRGTCSLCGDTSPHNLVFGGPFRRPRPWCSHAHRRQVPGRRLQSTSTATKCQGGHRRATTSDRLGSPQTGQRPSGAKLKVLQSSLVGGI